MKNLTLVRGLCGRTCRQLLAALGAALAFSGTAQAISFTPLEMDFAPTGRGATQVFRLENTTAEVAAIEISVMARAMAANGDDQLQPADEAFSIHPAQVVLQPGQAQTVRVQYTGAAPQGAERAFRLIAEQLPVDIGAAAGNGGRMRLLVKYVGSVYVVPPGVRAVLSVPQARLVDEGAQRWLELTVVNEGGARRILKDARVQLGSLTLSGEQLKGLEGENILARTTRVFRLPVPQGLNQVSGPARLILP